MDKTTNQLDVPPADLWFSGHCQTTSQIKQKLQNCWQFLEKHHQQVSRAHQCPDDLPNRLTSGQNQRQQHCTRRYSEVSQQLLGIKKSQICPFLLPFQQRTPRNFVPSQRTIGRPTLLEQSVWKHKWSWIRLRRQKDNPCDAQRWKITNLFWQNHRSKRKECGGLDDWSGVANEDFDPKRVAKFNKRLLGEVKRRLDFSASRAMCPERFASPLDVGSWRADQAGNCKKVFLEAFRSAERISVTGETEAF